MQMSSSSGRANETLRARYRLIKTIIKVPTRNNRMWRFKSPFRATKGATLLSGSEEDVNCRRWASGRLGDFDNGSLSACFWNSIRAPVIGGDRFGGGSSDVCWFDLVCFLFLGGECFHFGLFHWQWRKGITWQT